MSRWDVRSVFKGHPTSSEASSPNGRNWRSTNASTFCAALGSGPLTPSAALAADALIADIRRGTGLHERVMLMPINLVLEGRVTLRRMPPVRRQCSMRGALVAPARRMRPSQVAHDDVTLGEDMAVSM